MWGGNRRKEEVGRREEKRRAKIERGTEEKGKCDTATLPLSV